MKDGGNARGRSAGRARDGRQAGEGRAVMGKDGSGNESLKRLSAKQVPPPPFLSFSLSLCPPPPSSLPPSLSLSLSPLPLPPSLKRLSVKQDEWLESCIQMISGLVAEAETSPGGGGGGVGEGAGDDEDEFDWGADEENEDDAFSGEGRYSGSGGGVAGGGAVGGLRARAHRMRSPDRDGASARGGSAHLAPGGASDHGEALRGRTETRQEGESVHMTPRSRQLQVHPDTSPRWDTAPGTRGSLRQSPSRMAPPSMSTPSENLSADQDLGHHQGDDTLEGSALDSSAHWDVSPGGAAGATAVCIY